MTAAGQSFTDLGSGENGGKSGPVVGGCACSSAPQQSAPSALIWTVPGVLAVRRVRPAPRARPPVTAGKGFPRMQGGLF